MAGKGPGGPPPQTAAQKVLEQVFEVAFKLLYIGDESGIRDSSKNLRVLWTRALLNTLGKIQDDIAYELLPAKTRALVGPGAKIFWDGTPMVSKLGWIVDRTKWIDSAMDEFLADTAGEPYRQVVVLGAGYDTRSLRYRAAGLQFIEVDLPDISATKKTMQVDAVAMPPPSPPAPNCGYVRDRAGPRLRVCHGQPRHRLATPPRRRSTFARRRSRALSRPSTSGSI